MARDPRGSVEITATCDAGIDLSASSSACLNGTASALNPLLEGKEGVPASADRRAGGDLSIGNLGTPFLLWPGGWPVSIPLDLGLPGGKSIHPTTSRKRANTSRFRRRGRQRRGRSLYCLELQRFCPPSGSNKIGNFRLISGAKKYLTKP